MSNLTNAETSKRSEKTLELIFENSLDAILLIEPSAGRILMANPAACKMFRMTEDELKQVGREGVMVMDDAAVAALEQRAHKGQVAADVTYKRKDGSTFCGELASKTFTGADGTIQATVIIRDMTEQRKIEKALKESKDRLELAQSVANLGSWEFNSKKDEALWSKQLYNIFEINPETKAPNISEYSKLIHPDDLRMVAEKARTFQANAKLGDAISFDYRILTPKGLTKILHTERRVIEVDEDNKPLRIMGIEQDITDRKKVEDQLQQYSKDLEALVEKRTMELRDKERLAGIGETAGMVGHDIRNPLQAIVSELYMAKESMKEAEAKGVPTQEAVESIDFVQQQVDYISKIVQDLQDYARQLKPEFREADLSDILVNVFSTTALPDNIKLNVHVKGTLKFNTDRTFMNRALTNLVNNAIQAMPVGGELKIEAYPSKESVVIKVGDTGVGISEKVKPLLFKPLMTTKAKGQGLGLAVVKRLIEALGGHVSFKSEEGKGTTFTIELPNR